jgi:hypothetical protein
MAMIDDKSAGTFDVRTNIPTDSGEYLIPSSLTIALVATVAIAGWLGRSTAGKVQTMLASALIAALSRVVPIYSSPLVLVPVYILLSVVVPGAITSVSTFIGQLSGVKTSRSKIEIFVSAIIWHVLGALVANYICDAYLPPALNLHEIPFVSKKAIAQEFFFSVFVGFVGSKNIQFVPFVLLAGWLATAGPDMAHLSSAISLSAYGLDGGRLVARLLWQTIGSLLGATWITNFADYDKIDFNPIVSVTRTTDGKRIRGE